LISGIVPAGVINILSDSGSLGPVLASHPEVTMISFSGSVDAGRSIMASAAPTLKRLSLNIDGNDAAILLADVDIDKAADDLFKSAFANSGQSGVGVKRVYAHRSIYNQLCETLSYTAKRTKVGNGMDEDVTMGPIQNGVSYEHAKRYLATANIDGDVLSGGSGLEGYGYFIQPTIVRNIPKNSSLVTEIQYCPILPIMAFDHVGDALEQVGGPTSDLGVSIWTNRPAYAHDLAVRVQARNVWINGHADLADISVWSDDQQSTVNFQIFTELLASVTKPQTLRFVTMQ
jgi:aldehyde dehydrogenase (NAD+)